MQVRYTKMFQMCDAVTGIRMTGGGHVRLTYSIVVIFLMVGLVASRVDYRMKGVDAIPTDIPSNVTHVFITHGSVTIIPAAVFDHLSQLTYLYLYNNKISIIDDKAFIEVVDTLVYLNLGGNMLTYMPPALTETMFIGLKNLQLFNNKLTYLSAGSFDNYAKLSTLTLYGNIMNQIDTTAFMGVADTLTYLGIYSTQLASLGAWLTHTPFDRLTHMNIQSNRLITSVPDDAFKMCPALIRLYFHYSAISHIGENAFQGVAKTLQILFLNKNKLNFLGSALLDTFFTSLQQLHLNDNNLTIIPAGAFVKFPKLKHLYLQNNKIRYIYDTAFHAPPSGNILTIDISDNPLHCDANLCWIQYLKATLIYSAPVCASPSAVAGQSPLTIPNNKCPGMYALHITHLLMFT